MIKWLKKIFYPTKFHIKPEHETVEAFESGGVVYRCFVNEQKIPYMRAMAALDIYVELEEKTDAEYHKISYNTVLEYLRQGYNDRAAVVCHNALDRMNNITNVEIVYKLASVYFIAPDENPYYYDREFNERKILKWKQENDIEAFFLKIPFDDYLPSFNGLDIGIKEYTKGQLIRDCQILKDHLLRLSGKSKNKELVSTLELRIKELEVLLTTNYVK
jgi:hypothetical protein